MRIALVAHIRHPIAPPFAGGMEAHSWHLARSLAARGHDVTLFASGDSEIGLPPGVRLRPIVDRHYDAIYPWHRFHGTQILTDFLDEAHARLCRDLIEGDFDVIHNNSLHRFVPRLGAAEGLPMVTSLHVPPFETLRRAVHDSGAPWAHFTVTSHPQADRWWPEGPPTWASVLSNGVNPGDWPFIPHGDGSGVWAGRITPTKGTHLAAEAAGKAGLRLRIFGTIEHRDYFEDSVRPHLSDAVTYDGHLAGPDLAAQIGRASVLLFTPLWDEPFGLAAIEAMACGVPVACIDRGAVREVVGNCGAYAAGEDATSLVDAIFVAMKISRKECRSRVERLFSTARIIDRTENLYGRAMDGRSSWVGGGRSFAPHQLCVARAASAAEMV